MNDSENAWVGQGLAVARIGCDREWLPLRRRPVLCGPAWKPDLSPLHPGAKGVNYPMNTFDPLKTFRSQDWMDDLIWGVVGLAYLLLAAECAMAILRMLRVG